MKRTLLTCSVLVLGACCNLYAGSWKLNITGPAAYGGSGLPYDVYLPDTQPKPEYGSGRALMVALHGCKQDSADWRQYGNLEPVADEFGMVVALPDENGEHSFGEKCWLYWGGEPNPTMPLLGGQKAGREDDSQASRIIQIINSLVQDTTYNIDPNQVYVVGLSAGGGMVQNVACLAPDLVAGFANNAGPMMRTDWNCAKQPAHCKKPPSYVRDTCNSMAGSYSHHLDTQITALVQGGDDEVVTYNYLEDNTKGYIEGVYADHGLVGKNYIHPDSETALANGTLRLWEQTADPTKYRVSQIIMDGMGHTWPSGSGLGRLGNSQQGKYYFDGTYINYPEYVTRYFFENNMRMTPPGVYFENVTIAKSGQSITVQGVVKTEAGNLTSLQATITAENLLTGDIIYSTESVSYDDLGKFIYTKPSLPTGYFYSVTLQATDDDSNTGNRETDRVEIGDAPDRPTIDGVSYARNGDCLDVSAQASDSDGNLDLVKMKVSTDATYVNALLNGNIWERSLCNLPSDPEFIIHLIAVDTTSLTSDPVYSLEVLPSFNIENGTINDHVIKQRFTYYPMVGYGACDATYLSLLNLHGAFRAFKLYGKDGVWCSDPHNLP